MRRQTAGQQDFSVYDFSGGLNIKSAPQELADNDLSQALNGYLRPDGGFESRRGLTLYKQLPNATAPVQGLFRFYQKVRTSTGNEFVITIAQCGNELWNLDSGTVIAQLGHSKATPWSVVIADDPNASNIPNVTPGLTQVAVICVGGGSGPYIFDGVTLYHPDGWKPAKGAEWCENVNGIVWFGGMLNHPNEVMSTGSGIPPDVSFETIAGYAIFDLGQPVVGLETIGSGAQAMLGIGLPTGLGLLYGTGPANYTLQMVPMDNDGVASGYSMVSNNNVLYFLGNNNTYSYNPLTNPTPVPFSLKVQPWIIDDPFTVGYVLNGSRENFNAFIYYDRFHLIYSSSQANYYDTMLVYDTNIQGWTVLSLGQPVYSVAQMDAPSDVAPNIVLVGSTAGQVFQWDPYVGQASALWNDCAWNVAIWDDTTVNWDNGTVIPVWMATKFFKIGEPGSVKALHRLYPEVLYEQVFVGNVTVQTDYGLSTIFSQDVVAPQTGGALWDQAFWDMAFWNSTPQSRTSWNAPASRVDIYTLLPNSPANFFTWNVNLWNTQLWGGTPLPPVQAPGIQAEAFSLGLQSGISSIGGLWDKAIWDNALWGGGTILPWVFSGITGSFAQNGKR